MTPELPPVSPSYAMTERIRMDLLDTNPPEFRPYLGMSGIAQCPRKQWLKLTAPLSPADVIEDLRMAQYHETGYMHEAKIKWRLERIGLYVPQSEWTVVAPFTSQGGVEFMGHTDGATQDEGVLECKSASCWRFKKVLQRQMPLDEHLWQVNAYMRYGPWNHAWFVYVNRCNYEWLALRVEKDEALGAEIEERAKLILSALDTRTPPECLCGECP